MIFAVLLVAGVSTAMWLGCAAHRCWREQQALLAYELVPRYAGAVVRGVAALAALGCATVGGVQFVSARPVPPSLVVAAERAVASDAQVPARAPVRSPQPVRSPAPSSSPSASVSAAAAVGMVTVGHPAGGELRQGVLPGYPGQLRIWLPQQYPHRSHPLQALVVQVDDRQLPDVLAGLVTGVAEGRANPFVVVLPGCAGPVDGDRLRTAVARSFHVEPAVRSWGVLGVGTDAQCAAQAELAHPESYAAGAGVSGAYDSLLPAVRSGGLSGTQSTVRLLLAVAQRDSAGQAAAARLRRALTELPQTQVRLSNSVRDIDEQQERVRLCRLAVDYLTEQMALGSRSV